MQPKVFIVILNYNSFSDTHQCLESLIRTDYRETYLVIVDNGSVDGSFQRLLEHFPEEKHPTMYFIQNRENLGFAGGCNRGIQAALAKGADYVLLLNNDTVVAQDTIPRLIKTMEEHPEIGIAGGTIYHYEEPTQIWYAGGKINKLLGKCRHFSKPVSGKEVLVTGFISGCMMIIPRWVFDKIGLLDERYFFGAEDLDYCLKAKKAEIKLGYIPQAKIWHKIGSCRKGVQPWYLCNQYLNRALFLKGAIGKGFLWRGYCNLFFIYGILKYSLTWSKNDPSAALYKKALCIAWSRFERIEKVGPSLWKDLREEENTGNGT